MSMASRKMMLVPLPLALQHCLKFTSDHLPTLTLLGFVVIQFVLNILHYIPAKYWQAWVDRTRHVLKTLLDSDYRHEKYQIDLLRQRLAESDRRNASAAQELDVSQENSRSLRERLVKHSAECDIHKETHASEMARVNRQLEAQGKLLVETEALLDALRAGDSTRLARHHADDKNIHAERVKHLEEHIATLTKERREIAEDVLKLQGAHQTVQDHCNKILHSNAQLQAEKEDLVKKVEAMEAMERRLTESRDEALTRLNQTLQYSTSTNTAFDQQRNELLQRLDHAVASKNESEQLLREKEQQLATLQSQPGSSPDMSTLLQEKIEALEGKLSIHAHNATSQQATEQDHALEQAQKKLTDLEAALADKMRANDELSQQISSKDEEISRLAEIIEHGDLRPHKLKKPRTSMPLTPPATVAHNRSNSISSRFGFDRERQRTVSTGSVTGTNGGGSKPRTSSTSPAVSPQHRAQASLPPAEAAGTSGSVEGVKADADTSMGSISGSTTLAPPSLGKSSRRRSGTGGTRQRLSSILGIHIGGEKDKDAAEKEKEKH